jgi:hypothetical protein
MPPQTNSWIELLGSKKFSVVVIFYEEPLVLDLSKKLKWI